VSGPDGATLQVKANINLKPIHDLNTPTQSRTKRNARVYRLQPAQAAPAPARPATVAPASLAPARVPLPRPAPQPLHPTEFPTPAVGQSVIKVGLDIDLQRLTATVQWDHLQPKPARDFKSPAEFVAWVREQTRTGHVVYTVYESCGFGYCLHYDLKGGGRHLAGDHALAPGPLAPPQE
jgi:hypothetical protein